MNPIGAAKEVVDAANAQSDRWLFLAALGMILIGGTVVIRWLVARYDRAEVQSKTDRESYQTSLKDLVTKGHEVTTQLVLATENNTRVIEENTAELKKRRRELNEQL